MREILKGYLRKPGRNRFLRSASRLLCAASLALLLPVMASAYTIVLRSGRRIEIPARFTVTPLALTYETAPGINITILMSSIDIQATERANGELAGSLLKRADQESGQTRTLPSGQKRRELTQADIEAGRSARRKSEQDYERRRRELGLPSLEETRRRTQEETARMREESLQSQAEEAQSEAYWRARASSLRTEIAALGAQIDYIRERLAMVPDYSAIETYASFTGFVPNYPLSRSVARAPVVTGHPGFMHGINGTPAQSTAGFLAFGGVATHGRMQLHAGVTRGNIRRGVIVSPYIVTPPVLPLGVPSSGYGYNQESAELISRLHELEAQRAGLQARWRLLEEDARRAGAQPGWLRY